jgi:hypothetical protein
MCGGDYRRVAAKIAVRAGCSFLKLRSHSIDKLNHYGRGIQKIE